MADRGMDGPIPSEGPLPQALTALKRWARGERPKLSGLTVTTAEALLSQIRADIESHYSGRDDERDATPVEVAEDLANARLSAAVQFDQAISAAERWIAHRRPPPGQEREDLEQEAMSSILLSFQRGDILADPNAFGRAVASRRWTDACRRNSRRLQTLSVNPLVPEEDDEPPSSVALAPDPHSEAAIAFVDDQVDRAGELERRCARALAAVAHFSAFGANPPGFDRRLRCPEHRHRRRHPGTDDAYHDVDLAVVWIVFFFAAPSPEDCPADWSQLRWAALGSVNPGRFGTWAPASERRSTNDQAVSRSRGSLCLLWRLWLVADFLEEVSDLVLVWAPNELRRAMVAWIGSDQVPWATVKDASAWCEKLVECLLGRRGGPTGRWEALRHSESLAYRKAATAIREKVAINGVPAGLENDTERLVVDLVTLAERLSETTEFPS